MVIMKIIKFLTNKTVAVMERVWNTVIVKGAWRQLLDHSNLEGEQLLDKHDVTT